MLRVGQPSPAQGGRHLASPALLLPMGNEAELNGRGESQVVCDALLTASAPGPGEAEGDVTGPGEAEGDAPAWLCWLPWQRQVPAVQKTLPGMLSACGPESVQH